MTIGPSTLPGLRPAARRGSPDSWLPAWVRAWRQWVPQDIPQPAWAQVSRRAWRRHSALLTCLHDERADTCR